LMMEEELRRQEILALDRKSQIEELKQRVNDLDVLNQSQVNNEQEKTSIDIVKKVRDEMTLLREQFSAEITEQSEKHLERERHLSSQILSYQTEMAAYKDTKGRLQKEI
jgi:predicted HD phosphohydrolase